MMHENAKCPTCTALVEARAVIRGSEAVHLIHCNTCGPSETVVSTDAKAFIDAFLARGEVPEGMTGDHFFKDTTSTCPGCLKLLPAKVVIRDGKVFFLKNCDSCGKSEALVSENAKYYVGAYAFARAGTEPLKFGTEVEHGCPTDCGTCGDHEQHTCVPIVEVTDHCNLECPICIVNNQYANHISLESFTKIIDVMVRNEGQLESIALSGGEPTSHPQILELVDIANRDEIGRVVVITNGLRLGKDRKLAEGLKERGAYVALQFDGFTADTHEKIRGRDLCKEKAAALAVLKELNIPTQLIFVAARGANEHQIGQIVELFLSEDHFLSLSFQPAAFTGLGGGAFPHDPMDRLTIPGVIAAIEEQTKGLLVQSDFSPLPCSHPQCVSLTYLLRLADGTHMPFGRFVDFTKHGTLLRSSATLGASPEIHDAMHDVVHARTRSRRPRKSSLRCAVRSMQCFRIVRSHLKKRCESVKAKRSLSSCTTIWIAMISISSACASAAITTRRPTDASCRRAALTCFIAAQPRAQIRRLHHGVRRLGRQSSSHRAACRF
jgi:7,8-dihydro-6-hydroxymethylpterin dimethyltransferase